MNILSDSDVDSNVDANVIAITFNADVAGIGPTLVHAVCRISTEAFMDSFRLTDRSQCRDTFDANRSTMEAAARKMIEQGEYEDYGLGEHPAIRVTLARHHVEAALRNRNNG